MVHFFPGRRPRIRASETELLLAPNGFGGGSDGKADSLLVLAQLLLPPRPHRAQPQRCVLLALPPNLALLSFHPRRFSDYVE